MIQWYKYATNKYDLNVKSKLDYQSKIKMSYDTSRNRYKLVPKLCKYQLRKRFFVHVIVNLWNMLPDKVVSVSSASSFKRHLGGFWCDLDLYYNYKAEM